MNKKKIIITVAIFAASVVAGLYPFISNYIYDNRKDGIIETYEDQTDTADADAELTRAEEFNTALAGSHVVLQDPFNTDIGGMDESEYWDILNVNGDDVMGIVSIPCIDVELPIYHGTSEEVLEKGVGHLEGTSFPVGGGSTHAVLTGHTGLSSAKLFTDLAQLEEGDLFFVTCLNRKLAYEVDQILVVEPSDTKALSIVDGKDYCTLVTCTPYGVNSHRLLVRGERTEYVEDEVEAIEVKDSGESQWMNEYKKSTALCFGIAGAVLVIGIIVSRVKERRNRNAQR